MMMSESSMLIVMGAGAGLFALAVVFFSIATPVRVFGRWWSTGADLLGLACLFASGYFILSPLVVPAYAKAAEIYALSEQFSSSRAVRSKDLTHVLGLTAALFSLGVWKGWRKVR